MLKNCILSSHIGAVVAQEWPASDPNIGGLIPDLD